MMQDLKKMAEQQHALDVKTGRALPDGTRVRTADGTPILPPRYNEQGQLVDNWGSRIRGKNLGPIPGDGGMKSNKNWAGNYKSDPLIRLYVNFSTRLFCGTQCSVANAPTSASADTTPKLSDARIARNAVSQALAARSVVKFLGKVGVVIDEGVDGVIDRLMPEEMAVLGRTGGNTLATKERYARAVRNAFREVTFSKYRMIDLNVRATAAHKNYLDAVHANANARTLITLAEVANTYDELYMAAKRTWYESQDEYEKATKIFENYIKFGQWEQSGLDVPDPETTDWGGRLDPYNY